MAEPPSCTDPEPHTHYLPPATVFFTGRVLFIDQRIVALIGSELIADRIVELLRRHGLHDVPDHLEVTE